MTTDRKAQTKYLELIVLTISTASGVHRCYSSLHIMSPTNIDITQASSPVNEVPNDLEVPDLLSEVIDSTPPERLHLEGDVPFFTGGDSAS